MFEIPARYFTRYYEILSVLIRHGLGYVFISGNLRPMQEGNLTIVGAHLRNAFAERGPAFVKLGQLASTRTQRTYRLAYNRKYMGGEPPWK